MATKSAGPWQAVYGILQAAFDRADFNDVRLAAIENRLAMLDGGGDASACRKAARGQLAKNRVRDGLPAPVGIKDE